MRRIWRLPPTMMLILGVISGVMLVGCQSQGLTNPGLQQPQLDKLAQQLQIHHQVLSNDGGEQCDPGQADGHCFKVALTITALDQPLPADGWQIRFSQVAKIQSSSGVLQVEHINGDLHQLQPTAAFAGLAPTQSVTIHYFANYWSISNSDAMPNYYLQADGLTPRLLLSTQEQQDSETLLWHSPFAQSLSPDLLYRGKADNTQLADAETLFKRNQQQLGSAPEPVSLGLIPQPLSLQLIDKSPLLWQQGYRVVGNDFGDLDAAWQRLASLGFVQRLAGVPLQLRLQADFAAEAYRMNASAEGIEIVAGDRAGAFYALQSLAGLHRLGETQLAAVAIEDQPRYSYRGMHIDLSRNFLGEPLLRQLIEQMGAYKLNKLHLHLADDEGWRLQIPGLEELTEVGAFRCAEPQEQQCLLPQLGSGVSRASAVNGYLSVSQYIDLLRYAAAHQIEVIPSFDMPGHSRAAIRAMEQRYRRLMAANLPQAAQQFRLVEPTDESQYLSVQYYLDNTLNPCIPATYRFTGKVLDEVQQMHRQAGVPLKRYHIGADETAGAWTDSPACQALISNSPQLHESEQLLGYFTEQVVQQLQQRGIEAAAWSDGLFDSYQQLSQPVAAYGWDVLAWQGHERTHQMLQRQAPVVLSSPDVLYFDFPYEADPDEGGYYWGARAINTHKIFSLMPDNLPANAEQWQDRQGNDYQVKDPHPLSGQRLEGLQGQLWSETVRHPQVASYKIYPRLLALAERAWHQAPWELAYQPGQHYGPDSGHFNQALRHLQNQDWQRFATLLAQQELPKLDKAGVFYRVPTAGGQIVDGVMTLNVAFPGLALEYRTNQGDWQAYSAPVAIHSQAEIRARSADGQRPGRTLTLLQQDSDSSKQNLGGVAGKASAAPQ